MSKALLDVPSVDRIAIAAGRAIDPALAGVLRELRVVWNRALWANGAAELESHRSRGLPLLARARERGAAAGVWASPCGIGLEWDDVRSFSGSIGVHYATQDGRPVVVKAAREPADELAAADLARRLGLSAPALWTLDAAEVAGSPADGSGREVLLVADRVEGFDIRNAPLAGWRLDPSDTAALEALGEIAAFDVAIGNHDRFRSGNTGNLMIAAEGLVAIDNEGSFSPEPAEVWRRFREPDSTAREIGAYFGVDLDAAATRAIATGMGRLASKLEAIAGAPDLDERAARAIRTVLRA